MNKPDALLFDMDGVLVNSIDSWHQALRAVFKYHLNRDLGKEEFVRDFWGRDVRDIFKDIGLDLDVGSFCNTVYDAHADEVRIFPETKACLERLNSYRKAVITNTPESCARRILDTGGIGGFFEAIVTSDKVKRAKPDPAIVYEACRILEVDPPKTLLIGDHAFDMEAGRAAGCTVVGIGVEGDYTLDRLGELTDIVDVEATR
jgi:HAD superfamily hydrolase (TIGR01509 family)